MPASFRDDIPAGQSEGAYLARLIEWAASEVIRHMSNQRETHCMFCGGAKAEVEGFACPGNGGGLHYYKERHDAPPSPPSPRKET